MCVDITSTDIIEVSSFLGTQRTCLKADSRYGEGISVRAALRSFKVWLQQQEFDPIEEVAEEMLLCEIIIRFAMQHTIRSSLLMRVPCSRTAKYYLTAAADRLLGYPSVYV
jgi:hypothetical protein